MMISDNIHIAILTIIVMLIFLSLITFPAVFVFHGKFFRFAKQIRQAQNNDRDKLQNQLKVKDQALKNISHEIHDNIGHVLALVKLHLSSIQIRNSPLDSGKLHQSIELLNRAVNDLRDLSRSMQAENIDKAGLPEAIKNELSLIRNIAQLSTSLKIQGTFVVLGIAREIVIFRIVQEALSNIVKHAKAKEIIIVMQFSEKDFALSISDDGKGFIRQGPARFHQNGAGLNNMFSRAQLIGGVLNIETAPGRGTTINFSMPVQIGASN